MEKRSVLYEAFGKMVYLVAMADGLIQPEETTELARLIAGRSWASSVKWSFDELVAHPLDPAAVYDEVLSVFVEHGPDPAYQELFEILEAVAQASDGLDSDEANVLIDLEVDLRNRFLEDFERFELRYKSQVASEPADYQVSTQQLNDLEVLNLTAPNERIVCSINPAYGANLCSLEIQLEDKTIQLIDGYQTSEQFQANEGFRSGKLIPFPNRINQGQYSFEGQSYQLPINFPGQGHAIHGLIYDQAYRITHQENGTDRSVLELSMDFEGHEAYPFSFQCVQRFVLDQRGLSITTTVKNTGSSALPFGDGWHPYFCMGDLPVNKLELKIPPCQQIEVDASMIPTGELLTLNAFQDFSLIGEQGFDTGFLVDISKGTVSTVLRDPSSGLQLSIWQDTNYPYLQIYTPPHRQSIAVEPMSCATNAFNNGQGLTILAPGEQFQGSYGIFIDFP